MPDLTREQRARILEAFFAIDGLAWCDVQMDPHPEDRDPNTFYYDGYISLDGLWHVAAVIAQIQAEMTGDHA
jgi:hypothetical protein